MPKIIYADPPLHHPPHLAVKIKHSRGALDLDVNFTLTQYWTILFGPSGSGKTTILRAIAGLIRPSSCRIEFIYKTIYPQQTQPREPLLLCDSATNTVLPPHQRYIAYAPQQASLFPHLTVTENVKYGMLSSGRDEYQIGESERKVAELLDFFCITNLAEKLPRELSGGEAQRVNLARAAAFSMKRFLLLDEPFAGLDAPLRDDLLASLKNWQAVTRTPILSVTHDIAEAFQLNAEVLKLSNGRITHQGPPAIVLAEERARLLAQLNPNPTPAKFQTHSS